MIENLPKGAYPDPQGTRAPYADAIMAFVPPVDWNAPLRLPDPGNEDQGSSLSCVAQAWSYYHTQIHPHNYSRRDIYAQIFLPQGGAYIAAGGQRIASNGQATRDQVPDPSPETESNMRDQTGITAAAELPSKELSSFIIQSNTIDAVAQAIRDYKGVVFGVTGSNEGWQDMSNPRPPASGEETWGHALYALGYHVHDGVKCIIAKSSWCDTGMYEHHIKENYFESGSTFNAWTLIPKEQHMNQAKIVKSKKSSTVYVCYPMPSEDYLASKAALEGFDIPAQIPDTDSLS